MRSKEVLGGVGLLRRRVLIVAVWAAALTGCELLTPDTVIGRFTLESIDSERVPTVFSSSESEITEATAGELNADEDHTFIFSITLRTTEFGTPPETYTVNSGGLWSQTRAGLLLVGLDGAEVYADLQGGELTFSSLGRTYRLVR